MTKTEEKLLKIEILQIIAEEIVKLNAAGFIQYWLNKLAEKLLLRTSKILYED
jgi:hypothetical protein